MNDIVGPLADRPCCTTSIPRSKLPELPEGELDTEIIKRLIGMSKEYLSPRQREFLCNVLDACYGGGE